MPRKPKPESDSSRPEKGTGPGRPAFKANDETRRYVASMVASGHRQGDIAKVVGCDEKTLRKHFADEIATAGVEANAKVADTLYQKAIAGDNTCLIFWLKCRAGWKEKHEVEHSGEVAVGTTLGAERFQSELARILARAREDFAAEKANAR